MTEVLWPLDLCPSSQTWSIIGNAATFTSPLSGATRTYGRPGARLGCTMTFPAMKGQDRARLLAFINTLLDRSNRVWVPDFSTTRRGSFPAQELLTNNDFSNGTSGWSVDNGTLSANDRVMRLTATTPAAYVAFARSATMTQYAPYALRSFLRDGPQTAGLSVGPYLNAGNNVVGEYSTARGLITASSVNDAGSATQNAPAVFASTSGFTAGAYLECHWSSLARCALVDGGGNLLLYSDQIDNAAWTKIEATVSANAGVAPDGTATADALIPSTNSDIHCVQQPATVTSSAADLCVSGAFRGNGYNFVLLSIEESAGGTICAQMFNLSTGAVGAASTGGGWSNRRAFITSLGNNWYQCTLIARKTGAGTTATARAYAFSVDSGTNFAGDGTSGIYAWRIGLVQSSVPVRLTQSTSAAVSASTQTGPGIYVKGLPPSTQGLLEAGDPVQIGGQLNFLTARLDSDASGRGYLQCGRPWLAATNDAPVIINTPMCKMILATDTIDLDTGPGQFSPFQIELVEAIE